MSFALTNPVASRYAHGTPSIDTRLAPAMRRAMLFALTVLAVAFFAPISRGQEIAAGSQDAEVLTRGPIHDAFAMPVGLDPVPGVVVPRQPPADIDELPPEVAVEDESAAWIAGYWNWDDERQDFIWISGVWRVAPPNHRWVAGYWTEVQGGFQRISGFWAPLEVRQVVYYSQPPQSLETGPNSPQPSPNHFWVPGNWVFTDGRYVWRGGYWAASQQNWVWIPAYYVNTPGGYIYNAGYWDHPLDDRGMMFAPVYFRASVYNRPNFYYSPSVLIRATSLLLHLFARPSSGNYYFGDYYGNAYANNGYYPYFAAGGGPRGNHRWYDPIYAYQRSHHGRDPNWSNHLHQQFNFYTANQDARPRRTYEDQRRYVSAQGNNRDRDEVRNVTLATSVADIFNNTNNTVVNNTKNITNVNIRRVQNDERKSIQKHSQDVQQFAKQRSQIEQQAKVDRGPRTEAGPRPEAGVGTNVGVKTPTLTLPELPAGTRVGVGPGPRNGAGPNAANPRTADLNRDAPNRGPVNGNPSDPAGRDGRPDRPNRGFPQRPDAIAGPNTTSPNTNLPNGVNPNADAPKTGLPAPMPPGRRSASTVPGSDTPENPVIPPGSRPNGRAFGRPQPDQPNVPKLPQVPKDTDTTPMPKPNLPTPKATPPLSTKPMPKNPSLSNPDRLRGAKPSDGQPRIEQPRDNQPRDNQPRGNPSLGEQPRGGNGPGRGNRPDVGGVPGAGGVPGLTRERPQQTERPQRERPQVKPEPKPQEVPKVSIPVAPQRPPVEKAPGNQGPGGKKGGDDEKPGKGKKP